MLESNSKYFRDEAQIAQESPHRLGAVRIGNEIFLPKSNPLTYFRNYFHEVGHIIGDDLSFKDGQVLSPEEIDGSYIYLQDDDAKRLLNAVKEIKGYDVDDFIRKLGEDIITLFTKENFSLDKVIMHYGLSQEQLVSLVRSVNNTPGVKIGSDGNLLTEYSRNGRNTEISSYVSEVGCLRILENTLNLNTHGSPIILNTVISKSASSSHYRAKNLAFYAFDKNLVLPSMRDIRLRK